MTLSPGSLRARKKDASKERIYSEALKLFRRQGFAATTVEEIAAAAEVSKGTFFNYFPSKEALLGYLGEHLALVAAQEINAVLAGPPAPTRQQLGDLLRRLARLAEADREHTRLVMLESLKTPGASAAAPYRRLVQQTLTTLLAEGQQRGEVAPAPDARLLGNTLAGAYLQQLGEWCAAPAPFLLTERLDQMVAILWNGLGAD